MRVKGFKIFRPACEASSEELNYNLEIDEDLTELLPYFNREIEGAKYDSKGSFMRFVHKGHKVVVNGNTVSIAKFADEEEAKSFADEVMVIFEDIKSRKDLIEPDYTSFEPPSVIEIFKLLPKKAPCNECGYPACMAFATALRQGEAEPDDCKVLASRPEGGEKLDKLKELLGI